MKLKEQMENLKTEIPALFSALKDKETPISAKIFAALTVAYALSPIDLIPDFIPVLGYLDDIIILPILVTLTLKFIPKETMDKHRKKSEGMWDNGKPKKWYYALPILIVWALMLIVILKIIF